MRGAVAAMAAAAILAWPAPGGTTTGGFRIRDLDPMQSEAVEGALEGAARRLESGECRRIFTDFTAASGMPLQAELDRLGMPAADFLRTLVFTDGSGRRACRAGDAVAVTGVGSRVVYVCGRRFREAHARNAARAQMFVL